MCSYTHTTQSPFPPYQFPAGSNFPDIVITHQNSRQERRLRWVDSEPPTIKSVRISPHATICTEPSRVWHAHTHYTPSWVLSQREEKITSTLLETRQPVLFHIYQTISTKAKYISVFLASFQKRFQSYVWYGPLCSTKAFYDSLITHQRTLCWTLISLCSDSFLNISWTPIYLISRQLNGNRRWTLMIITMSSKASQLWWHTADFTLLLL